MNVVIYLRVVKLVKKFIKKILESIDDFWLFLNTENDNTKIEESRKELRDLIPIYSFAIGIFIILVLSSEYYKKMGEELSGFAFVFAVYIFILWVFVVLHTKKTHKRHFHQSQAKNSQLLHE